jgi:hypothetical protein
MLVNRGVELQKEINSSLSEIPHYSAHHAESISSNVEFQKEMKLLLPLVSLGW